MLIIKTLHLIKKFIYLLLVSFVSFSQTYIEVKLVNYNVGGSAYNYLTSSGTSSNDAGLNTILSQNNVIQYRPKSGNPFDNVSSYTSVVCNATNGANMLQQLQNYNSVIASANYSVGFSWNNMIYIKLLSTSTGTPTGTSGNIVVTNNPGLNQIFANYNIIQMKTYGQSEPNILPNWYKILSSGCNLQDLKTALQNYNSVIQTVEFVEGDAQLSNQELNKKQAVIYPNPFKDKLNIISEKSVVTYSIINLNGGTFLKDGNKIEFENATTALRSGMYFLQLQFDDGTKSFHKIMKN